jgi:ABC-type transport system involved in cytochrome c biogenesis permease subunit
MATSEALRRKAIPTDAAAASHDGFRISITDALSALASLRLTVVLFALSIFLVFAGTLAQVDHGVWDVVNHSYFRVWFAWVELQAFERLIQMFAKGTALHLRGGFYFPGGLTLGSLLMVNLIAAHTVRFKISASGTRLASGLAIIALGAVVTVLVIRSGANDTIESELTPEFCRKLWLSVRVAIVAAAAAGSYLLLRNYNRGRPVEWFMRLIAEAAIVIFAGPARRAYLELRPKTAPRIEWTLLFVVDLLLWALVIWQIRNPEVRLDDSGLRILWQLAKGLAAGMVLLVGCDLVFRQRAGIVLLHGGVAVLMLSELWTGISANEAQMSIMEGETANYASDIRTTELAIVDHSNPDTDYVVVVPASLLRANVGATGRIEDRELPFDIQVHRWLGNSMVREAKDNEPNAATAGSGLEFMADEARGETGVDAAAGVDFPAAYVELFAKEGGQSLGTYLVSPELTPQPIETAGKSFDLGLRHKRIYYPYSLTLKDFRFDRYTGTNTPKNFSSLVVLQDPANNVDREVPIWMNNPLRYGGTTFYQSDWDKRTEQGTVLQVVANPGWMAPYVACMLVMTGMLAHFGVSLTRFLSRTPAPASELQLAGENSAKSTVSFWLVPAIIVVIFAGYVASKARPPRDKPDAMQVQGFANLPLAYQGRIKPYDTVARNTLQILSGKQEVIGKKMEGWFNKLMRRTEKTPAIVWLLDAISESPASGDHRVFRIENLELLDAVGLEPREGSWRYSLNDLRENFGEVERQIQLAVAQPEEQRSRFQHSALELADKLTRYTTLVRSFRKPAISTDRDRMAESLKQVESDIRLLYETGAPQAVPPQTPTGRWSPLMEAEFQAQVATAFDRPVNQATIELSTLLDAYAEGDVASFNRQLAEYRTHLAAYEKSLEENAVAVESAGLKKSEMFAQKRINFEVAFNHFSPFYYSAVLCVVAFVLGVASWLGWRAPLRRASISLLWFTFALHTFALVGRIMISGRPPVTNLYSSAIFIGWACVLLALVLEAIYKLGLGNIVAAVVGFLTLLVAHFLSLDGDTFIVMQAVLDTQFWLATHVVCITLGYATTFLAGAFALCYILLAHIFDVLPDKDRKQLTRMIYGTLCFAIFFSFIGTVLGGLWADDSWGRFWGWDPKENGALIIVLFNALVLHARWGGIVGPRGLALLAIGGNIVTTWSWFGVNELGVGLHAYGASESSTAMWLLVFAVSQAVVIALGIVPTHVWHQVASGQDGRAI